MPLLNAHPVRFTPKGLADAYDSTDVFAGACRTLQNLVFDRGNPELVTSRPGVVLATPFGTFTTPTFVTVYASIGNVVYGMVSSGRNAGKDEPFAYNVDANTFTAISGITSANSPTSPATTGSWTPPSMTVVGTRIIIAHAGFSGSGSNFFGVLDISTPSAPVWSAANLATNALPSVPTVVANLNNRAYFACKNVLYFSDSLDPLTRTNASQSLTIGDTSTITALAGLPLQTTSSGILQSLQVFKAFQIWQVTGDTATSNLTLNYLSLNVGTSAPRTVAQTPEGTYFMAIDGVYVVDPAGPVRMLVHGSDSLDMDLQIPFLYATQPTRVSAGYSGGTYRIGLDTVIDGTTQTNEYWFDIERRRWNGPHSFPQDCVTPVGNYFVISHVSKGAKLYKSQIVQSASSVFTDEGSVVSFLLESSTLPKDGSMTEKHVVESTIELSSAGGQVTYQVIALDDQHVTMNNANVTIQGTASLWGTMIWGVGKWSSSSNRPAVYTIAWANPMVFQKMAIQVLGTSQNNIRIGTFFARYQDLGYTNMQAS